MSDVRDMKFKNRLNMYDSVDYTRDDRWCETNINGIRVWEGPYAQKPSITELIKLPPLRACPDCGGDLSDCKPPKPIPGVRAIEDETLRAHVGKKKCPTCKVYWADKDEP